MKLFKKYTNNVKYVGHPLADDPKLKLDFPSYEKKTTDIGIFPGSRDSEISVLTPILFEFIKMMNEGAIQEVENLLTAANFTLDDPVYNNLTINNNLTVGENFTVDTNTLKVDS